MNIMKTSFITHRHNQMQQDDPHSVFGDWELTNLLDIKCPFSQCEKSFTTSSSQNLHEHTHVKEINVISVNFMSKVHYREPETLLHSHNQM